MNKNDFSLISSMQKRLRKMIDKERNEYIRNNLIQASGYLYNVEVEE